MDEKNKVPLSKDYIEWEIGEVIQTLSNAIDAKSYKELISLITKADKQMQWLMTMMGIEST